MCFNRGMKTLTERAEQARIALQAIPGWQVKFISGVSTLSKRWVIYYRAGEYKNPHVGQIDELNRALKIVTSAEYQKKIQKL